MSAPDNSQNQIHEANVLVTTRVIASGIEFRGGKRIGLATIALVPAPLPKGVTEGGIPLSRWPEQIEKNLDRLTLAVSPIDMSADKIPTPGGDVIAVRARRRFKRTTLIEKPNDLWSTLFEVNDWSILVAALRNSQDSNSIKEVKRPTKDGNTESPDVYSIPRSEATLLYSFGRAREVLRALRNQNLECTINGCHVKTAGREIDPSKFTFFHKPWLSPDAPLTRFAEATASDAPVISDNITGQERQERYLSHERKEREDQSRRRLEDKAKTADRQHKLRTEYLKSDSVDKKISTLNEHAQVRTASRPPSRCIDACGLSSNDANAERMVDDMKAAHLLSTLEDVDEFGDPIFDPCNREETAWDAAVRATGERFHALQTTPSLARLLNLVVDVEFDLGPVDDELNNLGYRADTAGAPEPRSIDRFTRSPSEAKPSKWPTGHARYLFLRADFGDVAIDGIPIWSLAKLRLAQSERHRPGEDGHFWPCMSEEVIARLHAETRKEEQTKVDALRKLSAIFQYDGVVDLGAHSCDAGGVKNPRYDIASLDPINAVESDLQVDRRIQSLTLASPGSQPAAASIGVHTRRTGGLTLLDRWRQDQVTSQIATTEYLGPECPVVVLDAEDLTSGYRLDVGVMQPGMARRTWRSLMHRMIVFGRKDKETTWIEAAINELYGVTTNDKVLKRIGAVETGLERRMRADGASIAVASRLRRNPAGATAATTVFAEEIVAAWQGDPLGVECVEADPATVQGSEAKIETNKPGFAVPARVLDLDMRYSLGYIDDFQPPRLRYGWPYHFGMRPVFMGGVPPRSDSFDRAAERLRQRR